MLTIYFSSRIFPAIRIDKINLRIVITIRKTKNNE